MPAKKSQTASVAIITRTKNRPVLLRRAVESVLNQTYGDWLHVVVNDGGDKDEVNALLKDYEKRYDNRLKVIHNPKSLGMEAASNKGLSASDSTYVVIHDDDDSWHPDFLKASVHWLETQALREEVKGVLSHCMSVHERVEGEKVVETSRQDFNSWVQEITLWRMCQGNFFPPISFLFKREVFDSIGGMYREDLPVLGDWEFNLRFLQQFEIAVLPKTLSYYHFRVKDKTSESEYANSIIGGIDRHRFYHAFLKNEFLRNDLKKGSMGIGYMVNAGPNHLRQEAINYRLEKLWYAACTPKRAWVKVREWLNRFLSLRERG